MKLDSLEKLYVHSLKDLHSAEKQLLDALPIMEEAAHNEDLKAAFAAHAKETQKHVTRIETLCKSLEFEPGGHKCAAMEGLIKEGKGLVGSDITPQVLDAALIGAAQRIEHYEMAGYGTARAFADKLGYHEAADVLQKSLDEEAKSNRSLTRLAERKLNFLAMGIVGKS